MESAEPPSDVETSATVGLEHHGRYLESLRDGFQRLNKQLTIIEWGCVRNALNELFSSQNEKGREVYERFRTDPSDVNRRAIHDCIASARTEFDRLFYDVEAMIQNRQELIALVENLQAKNRDLGRQIIDLETEVYNKGVAIRNGGKHY